MIHHLRLPARHSAVEFKRYLLRFMMEFTRIKTLAGVKHTIYDQYDSLVVPLQNWLKAQGVHLITDCKVTDLPHRSEEGEFIVTGIHCQRAGASEVITVDVGDLVFFQNGSMTCAPKRLTKSDSGGWTLWENLAEAAEGSRNSVLVAGLAGLVAGALAMALTAGVGALFGALTPPA